MLFLLKAQFIDSDCRSPKFSNNYCLFVESGVFIYLIGLPFIKPCLQIYMRFLEYEMHNSNECKRNFVAIYDGSSGVEHLRNKFCSTVANDVMLVTSVGVVRLWADEGSRKSRFKILFTTFHERKWHSLN